MMQYYLSQGVYGDKLFLDPCATEEKVCEWNQSSKSHGLVTLAFMPAQKQLAQLWQCGAVLSEHLTEIIAKLTEACEQSYLVSQRCLYRSVSKALDEKESEVNQKAGET